METEEEFTETAKRRGGIWRAEVGNRVRELENRLTVARSLRSHERLGKPRDDFTRESETAIERSLGDAKEAIDLPASSDRVAAWWTGSAITAAWEPIHEAEARLIPLERAKDVQAILPRLLSWIQHTMPAGTRREGYEKDLREQIDSGKLDSALIQRAFEDVTAVNRERYANLRGFRNNLILVTAMLAALVGTLSLWHLANPEFISFCADAVGADGAVETACFGAASEPRGGDVLLVALFGAIGGMLAIAFGLAETKSPPSRYDPRIWQIGLKAAAGSATALAGVLLIQADLVVAPADSPSEALYLAYATIFGFSQQLFTRFVDKRAGELIDSDGEEAEAAAARQA
ncbi:MAG: hypothetical protein WDZ46_03945 [Solirubrobacterales bacterium]